MLLNTLLSRLADVTPPTSTHSDSSNDFAGIWLCIIVLTLLIGIAVFFVVSFQRAKKKEIISQPKATKPNTGSPIVCPNCKNHNLAFIAEYHRNLGLRIIRTLVLAVIIGLAAYTTFSMFSQLIHEEGDIFSDNFTQIIILAYCGIVYLILSIMISTQESRTHTKVICKDCGHVWIYE